ncbi:hypothetical protein LSH36_39g09010 [Paralvinella palmiformis]|uniref:Sulfotransferase domain-containing protein n=1 Tax=Paralvinella palmiformis TaxID=53620 RepID=A0AAD9NDN6_9ANNE|nr:hypothetical protein LSH36_39g09010 [Paralvinella palmiformis]
MSKNKNPAKPKFTPDHFHAEVEVTLNEFKQCLKDNEGAARVCSYIGPRVDLIRHLTKSLYEVFLNDWMSIFPREQFFVLRMEDYSKNKVYHIKRLLEFLGIKSLDVEQETNILLEEEAWKVQHKLIEELRQPIRNDTLEMLRSFFRPFNHQLATLLKDRRFMWDY